MKRFKQGTMTGTIYQGNPRELLSQIGTKIVHTLMEGGIEPDGLHALGILHAFCTAISGHRREVAEKGVKPDELTIDGQKVGQMPSFKLALMFISHAFNGREWTDAELTAMDEEVANIVVSMGGQKLPPGSPKLTAEPFMVPHSDLVH